jgi:hypothetical protein
LGGVIETMLTLLVNIALAGTLAGAIAVGIKRLFPKRGDWLPVTCSAFIPPFLITVYSTYRSLVALGLAAERTGNSPSNPISFVTDSVSMFVFFSITWLIIGVPAAFVALHLFRRT